MAKRLKVSDVVIKISANDKEFYAAFQRAGEVVDNFKAATGDANAAMASMAKTGIVQLTALSAAATVAAKSALDINKTWGQTQALGVSLERIKELKTQAQQLGPAVGKSAHDIADGVNEIVSTFGDSADAMGILEVAAKNATAGAAGTKESLNLISAVTKAYGDSSQAAAQKVSDLAFQTVNFGQTSIPELANSLQRVTAVANALGESQEGLFAGFATLTGVTGDAGEVATQYRALMTELLKPTDALAYAFHELGVASGQELVERFGSVGEAMVALQGYADQTGIGMINLFGSIQASTAAMALGGAQAGTFSKNIDEMYNAAGAADKAFEDFTTGINSYGFAVDQARANAEVFIQRLGQTVLDAFEPYIDGLASISGGLAEMDDSTLRAVVTIGQLVAGVAAGTAAFGLAGKAQLAWRSTTLAATLATQGATGAVKLFNATLRANPLGAVIALVISLSAALTTLIKRFRDARREAAEQARAEAEYRAALVANEDEIRRLIGEMQWLDEQRRKTGLDSGQIAYYDQLNTKLAEHYKLMLKDGEATEKAGGYFDAYKNQLQETITGQEEAIKAAQERLEELDTDRRSGKLGAMGAYNELKTEIVSMTTELERYQEVLNRLNEEGITPQPVNIAGGPDRPVAGAGSDTAPEEDSLARRWQLNEAYYDRLKGLYKEDAAEQAQIEKDRLADRASLLTEATKKEIETGKAVKEVLGGEIKLKLNGTDTAIDSVDNLNTALVDTKKRLEDLEKVDVKVNVVDLVKEIGNALADLADTAADLIAGGSERIANELAKTLAQLADQFEPILQERQDAIDAFNERVDEEEKARQEAKSAAEYEQNMQAIEQDLESLERAAAAETNIAKLRDIELQLQAARRKKREQEEARKAELEEKARREREKAEAKALADALALTQWEYETLKIQTENDAGVAQAENAQKQARVDQASSSLRMALMAIEYSAKALDPAGGFLYIPAAIAAGAAAAAVWAKPLPPDFTPSPLPARPFALGGIVMPRAGGTLGSINGLPSIVAEAGYPEAVIPLNAPSLSSFLAPFRDQLGQGGSGVAEPNQLVYSPTININVTEQTNTEKILDDLRVNFDRELFDMVNKASRRYSFSSKNRRF
jgi:TP901 family phage tail tape measure protein